jgi:hypothetical protein
MPACTQLTEDDKVFAAILYQQLNPLCYIHTHSTATINGYLSGTAPTGSAPDFTVQPSAASVDPLMIHAFVKAGLFKHRTVGVFGDNADRDQMNTVVLPALQRVEIGRSMPQFAGSGRHPAAPWGQPSDSVTDILGHSRIGTDLSPRLRGRCSRRPSRPCRGCTKMPR